MKTARLTLFHAFFLSLLLIQYFILQKLKSKNFRLAQVQHIIEVHKPK